MSLGVLNFDLVRPDWLNFGRALVVIPANEWTLNASTALPQAVMDFRLARRLRQEVRIVFSARARTALATSARIDSALCQAHSAGLRWSDGMRWAYALASIEQSAAGVATSPRLSWGGAAGPQFLVRSVSFIAGASKALTLHAPWQVAACLTLSVRVEVSSGLRRTVWARLVWDAGIPPLHGYRRLAVRRPEARKRIGRLAFACPAPGRLNFGAACFGASDRWLNRREVYFVINSAALIRVDDAQDIPASAMTLTARWDQWGWTLSANLIGSGAYAAVPRQPNRVQATVNQQAWQFIPDDLSYDRTFAHFSANLRGLSRASELISPLAAKRSYRELNLRTAAQLALQELPPDYTLVWEVPDWTLPPGVFQYENMAPLEAVLRVATAVGGRVHVDATDKIITVTPKWPRYPWDWNSAPADVTFPEDFAIREAVAIQGGQRFDAVLVSGGVSGMIAKVARAGQPGSVVAPTVTDTLITHADAARARGATALADAWPMAVYRIEIPLAAPPDGVGLVTPGMVVDFQGDDAGWRGLVTETTISVSANSGALTVGQSLSAIAPLAEDVAGAAYSVNLWNAFSEMLLSQGPVAVAEVAAVLGTSALVTVLPGTAQILVDGAGRALEIGQRWIVRDGRIVEEGPAGAVVLVEI